MKSAILIVCFVLTVSQLYSQELQCSCENLEIAEENQFKCEIERFENGASLYWQWNCESAWLTFENKKKVILRTCENETIYSCQRTGLEFLKEYKNYLLFQYKWASGCCTSPDVIFFNKDSGIEIERVPQDQFVWGDIEKNYLLYFSDSTLTTLFLLDHLTDKKYSMQFEPHQIENSINQNMVMRLNELFVNLVKNENELFFELKLENGKLISKRFEIE